MPVQWWTSPELAHFSLTPFQDRLPRGADGHPVREERVPNRHQGVWEQHRALVQDDQHQGSQWALPSHHRDARILQARTPLCSMTPVSASGLRFPGDSKPPTVPGIIVSVNCVEFKKSAICEPFVSALAGVLLSIILLSFRTCACGVEGVSVSCTDSLHCSALSPFPHPPRRGNPE